MAFGGDLVSELSKYLGPPNLNKRLDIDGQGGNPQVTNNLPIAFVGKSKHMEQLLEYKILGEENEWYTRDLLPLEKSDNINIAWTVFHYDRAFYEIEPYQGNPSYLTSSKSGTTDTMVRRGMAFSIPHEFWKTPMGQQQYVENMKAMRDSAKLTIYFLVIEAVLRAKNYYRNSFIRINPRLNTIANALRHKKRHWAVLNKGMSEFRRYHAEIEELMAQHGVKPNIWALPPASKILMTHGHSSETEYSSGGKLALDTRLKGQDFADTIRGVKIYETSVLQEEIFKTGGNPLSREREYGSFHFFCNYHKGAYLDTYKSEERFAARILDASNDGQETIVSARDLIRLSGRFNADGSLSHVHRELISQNNLYSMHQRLGSNSNNKHIDMFIGYDNVRSNKDGLYVMDYFGEMRETDVPTSDLKDFAKTCNNHLLRVLTPEERRAYLDASVFMDKLTDVPLDGDSVYYWQALALSGVIPGAENKPDVSAGIFRNNGKGCSWPPHVGQNGLAITVNGKATPLAFGTNKDPQYAPTVTLIDNANFALNATEKDALLGGQLVTRGDWTYKVVKQLYPPMGFGTPTGLRTLSEMHRSGDTRGYNTDLLREADLHYHTMVKVFTVWKPLFPGHELGQKSACPSYYRTEVEAEDELTAFGLNLYHHAQYPVFAVVPSSTREFYSFAQPSNDPTVDVNMIMSTTNGLATEMHSTAVLAELSGVSDVTAVAKLQAALAATTDPYTLDVFGQDKSGKTISTLIRSYRGKSFALQGKNLSFPAFLLHVILDGTAEEAAHRLSAVLQLLSNENVTSVAWDEELKKTSSTPRVGSRQAAPLSVPSGTPATRRQIRGTTSTFNTRLCVGRSSFLRLVQSADANKLLQVPIRPMNVLAPTRALGLEFDNGNRITNLADSLRELKAAAAPARGRNTVSALSNSNIMKAHLTEATHAGQKRSSPMTSSASVQTSAKRRVTGGVLIAATTTEGLLSLDDALDSIPLGRARYTDDEGALDTYTSEGTIPINVLEDRGSKLFTFDKHQGDETVYRTALINRFHDIALRELDPAIRLFSQSWLTTRINANHLENWWDNDCLLLVAFSTWRFRQRYLMGSGFMAEGGRSLGVTFHGFHNYQWADDIIRGLHTGHYTFHTAPVVRDPKRVYHAEDIVAQGYISGEDVSFLKSLQEVKTYTADPSSKVGSMVVKMVPYNASGKNAGTKTALPTSPQDIGGRWNMAVVAELTPEISAAENPIHGDSTYYYNYWLELDRINIGCALPSADSGYKLTTSIVNTACWLGHHRIFNPATKAWDTVIEDDGPFGSSVYKGVITDRDISGKSIRQTTYQNVYA